MNSDILFSSKTDEWYTPYEFFKILDEEFHFDLDPCANEINHKCEKYYTKNDDGLTKSWRGFRVFVNPPYGKTIGLWVKKAYYESKFPDTLVVMLLPVRTDTKWFHDYIYNKSEIRFIKGRLKFGGSKYNAPFPSMLVIFN